MDQHERLRQSPMWKRAVLALRCGYGALVVVVVGLVMNAVTGTPVVLAVGLVLWILAAITTAVCFQRARTSLPAPQPGAIEVRGMLLRDSVGRGDG